MSTKDFYSQDWERESGMATGLMKPGESITVSGPDGPGGIFDGSFIPDVQNISLDETSFPDYPLYKYKVTPYRIKQDSTYHYSFTDESGDTYKLSSIAYSVKGGHEVSYRSEKPNIVEIRWESG
jgi:hypothetical protein